RPHYEPDVVEREGGVPSRGVWPWLAGKIRRFHRPIWIITSVVLIGGAALTTQLQAQGVPQSDLVLGESQARDGQKVLSEHFPGGSGSPVVVLTPESELQRTADVLLEQSGIDSVAVLAA